MDAQRKRKTHVDSRPEPAAPLLPNDVHYTVRACLFYAVCYGQGIAAHGWHRVMSYGWIWQNDAQ
jgi:hypothetical protein